MRRAIDSKIVTSMNGRIAALMCLTSLSDSQLAAHLGYTDPSPIEKIRRQEIFLDDERRHRIAQLELAPGVRANVEWIYRRQGWPCSPTVDACEAAASVAAELNLILSGNDAAPAGQLPREAEAETQTPVVTPPEPLAQPTASDLDRAKLKADLWAVMEELWINIQIQGRAELENDEFYKKLTKEAAALGLPKKEWRPRTLAEMGTW